MKCYDEAIVLEELVCGYRYLMRATALLRRREEAKELFIFFFFN